MRGRKQNCLRKQSESTFFSPFYQFIRVIIEKKIHYIIYYSSSVLFLSLLCVFFMMNPSILFILKSALPLFPLTEVLLTFLSFSLFFNNRMNQNVI